jgi:hypothetical protein
MYPWPKVTADLGTVRVIYWARATDMASSSDVPFNSMARFEAYQDLLIFYVAYRVYLIEGEIDKAGAYRQEYESRLAIMNERIGSKPNYIPGLSGPKDAR